MRDPVYNVGREDLLSFCSWSFELTSNVYHEFSTVIYILYRRQKGIRKHRFRTYRFVIFCFCLGLKLVLCSLVQYDKYSHALENRNLNLEWKSIGRCKFSNTRYKFRINLIIILRYLFITCILCDMWNLSLKAATDDSLLIFLFHFAWKLKSYLFTCSSV